MWFMWIPRSDVNEHGTTVPRRCDVRPSARGGTTGRGLALPGPDGELAKKRCSNAQLAKRRSLSRAPAFPVPGGDRPGHLTTRSVGQTAYVAGEFTTESTLYRQQGVIQG